MIKESSRSYKVIIARMMVFFGKRPLLSFLGTFKASEYGTLPFFSPLFQVLTGLRARSNTYYPSSNIPCYRSPHTTPLPQLPWSTRYRH